MQVSDGRTAAEEPRRTGGASRPDRPLDRAAVPTAAAPARQVLALQAAAGNRAVAALVQGASVQRSPSTWTASVADVVALTRGNARTSLWPPVRDAVLDYGALAEDDHAARATTLKRLEDAITAWKENQARNWYSTTLDDKKAEAVDELTGLVARERDELRSAAAPGPPRGPAQPRPSAAVAVPSARTASTRTRPADAARSDDSGGDDQFRLDLADSPGTEIGGRVEVSQVRRGSATASPRASDSDSSDSDSSDEDASDRRDRHLAAMSRLLTKDGVRALPDGVHLRVHLTKKEHLPAISEEGLLPGRSKGIGQPDGPDRDPAHVYALDLDPHDDGRETTRLVSGEAGEGKVGLISTTRGDKDPNYSKGAVRYPTAAPPVRTRQEGDAEPSTYSFPLPLTPRSSGALAAFVNRHLHPDRAMSPDEVVDAVTQALVTHAPLIFADVVLPADPPSHA